jgi:hypothetical protein
MAGIRSGGIMGRAQVARDTRQQIGDLAMQGIGAAGKLATALL